MKKDRDTYAQFGGLIEPAYTIAEAVADYAVVPLTYEGRHVPQTVNKEQIDGWFDKLTRGLTREQAADLKKKFSTADQLNKAEQKGPDGRLGHQLPLRQLLEGYRIQGPVGGAGQGDGADVQAVPR